MNSRIASTPEIQEKIEHHYDDCVQSKAEAKLAAKFFVVMRSAKNKNISWTRIELMYELANRAMGEMGY